MEWRLQLRALAPLGLALFALIVRETTRPAHPSAPLAAGEGQPREVVPAPLAPAGPGCETWRVDPVLSSARIVEPGADALRLAVDGSLEFGADGALQSVELGLDPPTGPSVRIRGASTPFCTSAVPIVDSASAALLLERNGATCEWHPRLGWTRRLDGSAVCLVAGELSLDSLGLPRSPWTRILHGRRPAWLALELSLAGDE